MVAYHDERAFDFFRVDFVLKCEPEAFLVHELPHAGKNSVDDCGRALDVTAVQFLCLSEFVSHNVFSPGIFKI